MKGKKFDAAEKHFVKKEEQYKKQIKALEAVILEKTEKEKSNDALIASLSEQNAMLIAQNKKLMELCKLSEADLKILIEKDKNIAEAAKSMLNLMQYNGIC
jgi:hypothetical protein